MRDRAGSIKRKDHAAFGGYPQGYARGELAAPFRQMSIPAHPENAFTVAVSWPWLARPRYSGDHASSRLVEDCDDTDTLLLLGIMAQTPEANLEAATTLAA
jgi:hypothetical protein